MVYTKADKDGLTPMKRDDGSKELSVPAFPLEQINVVQIARDLSKLINQPAPRTWLSKFFSNNRMSLDNMRLDLVAGYIERVRSLSQSITNMQAELFLQPKVLQRIIDGDAVGAERLAELQIAEHRNSVAKHDDERRARALQLEGVELDNKLKQQRIELIDFVKTHIKPDDLSAYHKGLLLQSSINPEGIQHQDLAILQELKDSYIKEHKLKNDLLDAQVIKEHSQATISKVAAEKTVLDFKEIKKRK